MKEFDLNIYSGKVRVVQWGNDDAIPIVAAHGWLDNAATFTRVAPFLVEAGFKLLAIDLPGHGFSDHRPAGVYFHFIDYVPDIVSILDELKLEKAMLLGHSLGGGVYSLVAGTIPDRISHLALIDVLGPLTVKDERLPELIQLATSQYRRLVNKKMPCYNSFDEAVEARFKAGDMDIESVKVLVERGLKQVDNYYTWRTDPRLLIKPIVMFTETQTQAFLQAITAKTCFIRPNNGLNFDKDIIQARLNCISNISVFNLEGHHHVHLDSPELVGKILTNFFSANR